MLISITSLSIHQRALIGRGTPHFSWTRGAILGHSSIGKTRPNVKRTSHQLTEENLRLQVPSKNVEPFPCMTWNVDAGFFQSWRCSFSTWLYFLNLALKSLHAGQFVLLIAQWKNSCLIKEIWASFPRFQMRRTISHESDNFLLYSNLISIDHKLNFQIRVERSVSPLILILY